jgi:hypothetical protein
MAGLPSVEGLAGASIDEGSTPPWLWRLIAKMAMPRQEPIQTKGPPGSSPETAIQLPPIYATAPSPGTYADVDLASILSSPLFTDTLSKAFGPTPPAVSGNIPVEGRLADVRMQGGQPTIKVNSTYRTPEGQQPVPIDMLLAHEFTHARDMSKDPGIEAIRAPMHAEWLKLLQLGGGPKFSEEGEMSHGTPGTPEWRQNYGTVDPMEHLAVSVEQAIELMRNKATPEQVKKMDEVLPGTRVMYDHIQKSLGPAARDATANAPVKPKGEEEEAPVREMDTISAVDRDWFDEMMWKVENWQLDRGIKPLKDTVFGKAIAAIGDPLGAIGPGGPAGAIATWGSRSERVRDIFANPSFHNWIIKNATKKNLRGNFSQIRDNAPEEVIEQLYQEFLTSRKAPHGGGGGHGLIRTTK